MNRNLKLVLFTFLITLMSSLKISAQFLKLGDDPNSVILFEHDDFSWGIKKVEIIKKEKYLGKTVMERTVDSLYAFIDFKSDKTKGDEAIILDKSYHSLYTKMQYVKPVSPYAVYCFENGINTPPKNKNWPENLKWRIKVVKTVSDTIYRLNAGGYAIHLDPLKINKTIVDRIANDIIFSKNKNHVKEDGFYLDKNTLLEAVALGFIPNKKLHNFKNDKGEFLHIDQFGYVRKGPAKVFDSMDEIIKSGDIFEGQFIQEDYRLQLYNNYNKTFNPNHKEYKNSNGNSITDLFHFDFVDKLECATNINAAIKNCIDIKTIYLINPIHKEIPETIGQLTSLQTLGIKEASLVKIPNNIGLLNKLENLEFKKIDKLIFPSSFKNLVNLKNIKLEECNLNSIPKILFDLNKLESISISGNSIKELPEELAEIASFNYLSINYYPNMIIPKVLINKKNFRIQLVTADEKETKAAKKILSKLGKLRPENYERNIIYWDVTKSYY